MSESNRHPAKMLPEIARRAIAAYSEPVTQLAENLKNLREARGLTQEQIAQRGAL